MHGRLSPLQGLLLGLLARVEPRGVLTGGGALAGFHLEHRATRDLDFFWHDGRKELGDIVSRAESLLGDAGLEVRTIQRAPTFHRFQVSRGEESCVVDLVADSAEVLNAPVEIDIGGQSLLVDAPQEILVNKLTTLLSRSEIRDLVDVRALVEKGFDLDRGLADAPRKDAGFSPLVLAWVLKSFPVELLAERSGLPKAEAAELAAFRDGLIDRLLSGPPGS